MFLKQFPPVVMLHHVSDDPVMDRMKPYSITRESFVRLLDVLEEEGYKTIGFEDFDNNRPKGKTVILSFDDCSKQLWDFAIPELQRRKMKAVFYMTVNAIDGMNSWDIEQGLPEVPIMNQADLEKLIGIGMEVGSHAMNHVCLEDLGEQEVLDSLTQSKSVLEGIIGKKVISIAYPFGSIPVNHKRLVQEAGYSYALAIYTRYEDRYAIRRWIYHDKDDKSRTRKKLSPLYRIMRMIADKMN